jgi:hypothetical protein
MRLPTTYIITIFFIAFPASCLSSYQIALKNGARFTTETFWEKDNRIWFYAYGGIMGFEKDSISNITELKLTDSMNSLPSFKSPIPKAAKTLFRPKIRKELFPPRVSSPEKEAFIEEKRRIMMEIRHARAAFQKAKAINSDKRMGTERKKLLSLHTERSNLLKRVKDAYGEPLPAWWHTETPVISTE